MTATATKNRLPFRDTQLAVQGWLNPRLGLGDELQARQLAELVHFLCSPDCPTHYELLAGIRYMQAVQAPTRRPMLLVEEGSDYTPTLWLLGWRPGDETPIHDHDDSEVGVHVYKGIISEDVYPGPDCLNCFGRDLPEGRILAIKAPYIHRFYNRHPSDMAVSLHAYYPKLDKMSYYEPDGSGHLVVADTWES